MRESDDRKHLPFEAIIKNEPRSCAPAARFRRRWCGKFPKMGLTCWRDPAQTVENQKKKKNSGPLAPNDGTRRTSTSCTKAILCEFLSRLLVVGMVCVQRNWSYRSKSSRQWCMVYAATEAIVCVNTGQTESGLPAQHGSSSAGETVHEES